MIGTRPLIHAQGGLKRQDTRRRTDRQACRSGELLAGPVLFTSYLRTAETGGYVALARDVDMRSVVRGRDLAAEMPVCG